jgi:nardilysin
MLYRLPAVKEGHALHLTFPLPALFEHYTRKPDEYISHLIGHEGRGSLLSALKEKGWATKLSAGVSDSGHERSSAG